MQAQWFQLKAFLSAKPSAWWGAVVLNHGHFGLVVSILLFSKWKHWEVFHPQTLWYLLGLCVVLVVSAIAKVMLINSFEKFYHKQNYNHCPWCGRIFDQIQPRSSVKSLTLKQNAIFTAVTFVLLVSVWLPIIAHHLWVNTKFENIAFIVSIAIAVLISAFTGIAELAFAYCTTVYKMNSASAVLLTINFLLLKWQQLLLLVVHNSIMFTLVALPALFLLKEFALEWQAVLYLMVLSAGFQVFWITKLDKFLSNLDDPQIIGKIKSLINPIVP